MSFLMTTEQTDFLFSKQKIKYKVDTSLTKIHAMKVYESENDMFM